MYIAISKPIWANQPLMYLVLEDNAKYRKD